MSTNFDFSELENFVQTLQKTSETIKNDYSGAKPITEILTASFISKNTEFKDLETMFIELNIPIEADEFDAFPEEELDFLISNNTNFTSFENMIDIALEEQLDDKLNNIF